MYLTNLSSLSLDQETGICTCLCGDTSDECAPFMYHQTWLSPSYISPNVRIRYSGYLTYQMSEYQDFDKRKDIKTMLGLMCLFGFRKGTLVSFSASMLS